MAYMRMQWTRCKMESCGHKFALLFPLTVVLCALCLQDASAGPPSRNPECNDGEARLVGGENYIINGILEYHGDVRGLINVCENGQWSYICDADWTMEDASVACRELGYAQLASIGTNIQIVDRRLSYRPECSGHEDSLSACTQLTSGSEECAIAAVSCLNSSTDSVQPTHTAAATDTLAISSSSSSGSSTTTTTTTTTSFTSSSHNVHRSSSFQSSRRTIATMNSQLPKRTSSSSAVIASTPPLLITTSTGAGGVGGVQPVVYGSLAAVASVMTLSTLALTLAVYVMWRGRRGHGAGAGAAETSIAVGSELEPEVREMNPAYQTTACLIPSSTNPAYAGLPVNAQPPHLYEDML